MNVVLCCVGGKIFVVYSAITIIVNGKTKHGIKTPIAPPPSLRPSLLLTHYTRSFSIYTNYRFLQLTIAQTKAVKSFEKMKTSTKRTILLMTKKKKKKKMMRVMI